MRTLALLLCSAALGLLGAPASADPGEPEAWLVFSINVQDFSYSDRSAATVLRILEIHERHGIPVDFYLTGTIAERYVQEAPELFERLKASRVASVSYHVRPPSPYYTKYDWAGLRELGSAERRETVRRYETHGLDLATGRPTDTAGGYAGLAAALGYAPVVVSAQADGSLATDVQAVFRELGARMFAQHGRAIGLGEKRDGVWLRPEHHDLKLFQHVGEEAAAVVDAAVAEARQAADAGAPAFLGVKMHDNDFFASSSAWTAVYLRNRRRAPPWDPTVRAPLLDASRQAAMWDLYEATVAYAAAQKTRLVSLNAPMILRRIEEGGIEPRVPRTEGRRPARGPDAPRREPGSDPEAIAEPVRTPPAGPVDREAEPLPAAPPDRALLYLSGTMHIESKRQRWPDPDALIAWFARATATGMRWSVGADLGWLEGEPRAAEVVRRLVALGVQWDVHAHRHEDRATCAALLRRYGAQPTAVASGALIDEVAALREPVIDRRGNRWQAEILWGAANRPGHGAGADRARIGVWRPGAGETFDEHDPNGRLILVGGGPLGLAEAEKLARDLAGAPDGPPVTSASIMVAPNTLMPVGTQDAIDAIEAFAARMAKLASVRWATIAETAEAWQTAGEVPSAREVEGTRVPLPPERRRR